MMTGSFADNSLYMIYLTIDFIFKLDPNQAKFGCRCYNPNWKQEDPAYLHKIGKQAGDYNDMPKNNVEKREKSIYVEFRVKTTANAAILLAPCRGCDGYEIVLGMRGDTVSVIRERKRKPTGAGNKSV